MNVLYCGKTRQEMNEILNTMCAIEEMASLTDEETDAFDVAIQCIATVINRMTDNRPIAFEERE